MRLVWRIAKEARRRAALLAVAMLSMLALTAVNLFAPRVLTDMTRVVSGGMTEESLGTIAQLTALLLALYLSRILFRYLASYLSHKAAWNLVQDLRQRVYDHIQSFSMGFYHNKQTGDLMSRVTNDTATFEQLYAHIIPELMANAVTIASVTVILFASNAQLAALTCVPLPLILLSGWVFTHKIQPKFRAMQKAVADLNSRLHDNFNGIMEIQAFGQQARESRQVGERLSDVTRNMLAALNLSAVFHPGVEFLTSLGTVIVVGFGGFLAFRGQADVADIVGFLLYLALFYAPVAGLAQLLENFSQSLAGAERVLEILDTPSGIVDLDGAAPLPPARGEVRFEDVSFSYDPAAPVLSHVSFCAKPGQMVALVGPTGVGKTTAIQLAARFYEPDEGRVLVDGVDIRGVTLESLRAQIAMVLQDTFLFTGTVEENIAYANPSAPREHIVAAAKAARIHDSIMEMPDGYATQVGERGVRLSGGQKQRIAIARAVLRRAPILILDEATASVDIETEREIQNAIDELAGKRTVLAIAHRLSTVRRADLILVFEDGVIVQRGTHGELMSQDGLYKRLNAAQEVA